jgi:hypothetical protein
VGRLTPSKDENQEIHNTPSLGHLNLNTPHELRHQHQLQNQSCPYSSANSCTNSILYTNNYSCSANTSIYSIPSPHINTSAFPSIKNYSSLCQHLLHSYSDINSCASIASSPHTSATTSPRSRSYSDLCPLLQRQRRPCTQHISRPPTIAQFWSRRRILLALFLFL